MRFQWDENKNRANKKKHGLSFEQALEVFDDEYRLEEYDELHSDDEIRWQTIGMAHDILFVVYTERDEDIIRIISARFATREERSWYYGDRD